MRSMPLSRPAPAGVLATFALGVVSACSSGPPAPPTLAYGEEGISSAVYSYADSTSVSLSVMGQSMELSQEGVAEYDVAFAESASGVGVTLAVRSLAASLNQPMGAPVRVDETMVRGDLAFSLDRVGNATVSRSPTVADEASQMVSGLSLAHTFFPALPGRAARAGESWVDSLTYSGEEGPGVRAESSILTYTVVGDTAVDGRALLHIDFAGITTRSNDMDFSGLSVSQESELEVSGFVLWDVQQGVLFEQYREAAGGGQVRVPIAPVPIPIRVRSVQRARLQQQ
jgi:hypothetical protein